MNTDDIPSPEAQKVRDWIDHAIGKAAALAIQGQRHESMALRLLICQAEETLLNYTARTEAERMNHEL